ncbi:MAG: PD-(D/E)XK nuclease family protein [Alphaproteobacteria bacterium]|nr:PD-(D/E)XK nuclease family protein [Alphaproteobacteria bacterium]
MTILTSHWHHDVLRLTAQAIEQRYPQEQWPNILILMPNRRSCIAMREAFTQHAETLLLPRIAPLADAENELMLSLAQQPDGLSKLGDIPPAMSPWQHRMILAELVARFEQNRTKVKPSFQHVLALTDALIAIQQNIVREGLDVSQIDMQSIRFSDTAKHWQIHADFLSILFTQWPLIEREMHLISQASREQLLLQTLHESWQKAPPKHPVWLVGSTGSMPVVRQLMQVIHALPHGHVVLPNLDTSLHDSVPIGHAQYYLQASLSAMNATAKDAQLLGDDAIAPRQKMLAGKGGDVSNIEIIQCTHEAEEAGVISLIVREGLVDANKTIAIITPNIALMQRIRLSLMRYDVHVNTPQGSALAQSPAGQVWAGVLRCLDDEVSVLSVLELLHLEGVDCGESASSWNGFLNVWRNQCRGVQPTSLRSKRIERLASDFSAAASLLPIIREMERVQAESQTLAQWLTTLTKLVSKLAPQPLAGHEVIAQLCEQLAAASDHVRFDVSDITTLLQEALQAPLRKPDFSVHPRVLILSPMEARLQYFDRVILAGFNDGDWPQTYTPNPWLNLGQRQTLGMTPPEAQATLAEHDVHALGMAPELFITRSLKSEGTPTTPSRYLVKLEAQWEREGVKCTSRPWREWWAQLHEAKPAPIAPVAPSPPAAARPKRMRVTSLRHLFSDPYAIYAEYVLGLRTLDPYDQTPDASTLGSLVHRLIEEMLRVNHSPDDSDWLMRHIAHLESDARLYALWLPRIRTILRFVKAIHQERACDDVEMEMKHEVNVGPVTLVGKIDRLEKQGDSYSIHDYKTGNAPAKKDMQLGLEPQLIAYALMLHEERGALPEELIYWALPKARFAGDLVSYELGEQTLHQHAEALRNALTSILEEEFSFRALNTESDYAGISRNDEWAA